MNRLDDSLLYKQIIYIKNTKHNFILIIKYFKFKNLFEE